MVWNVLLEQITVSSSFGEKTNRVCYFYLVGHFYLTQLLLPLLVQSNGRIVNVSSLGHLAASENIDFSKTINPYREFTAYAESKLANILHTVELQRRYGERGIKAYSLHPGTILSTDLSREKTSVKAFIAFADIIVAKTMEQGAMTTLYCALSDEAQPGKYHSNCRVAQPSSVAYNVKKAQELWELSERIIDEKTKHL
jgi:WW domain-containing oxidoreductase